MERGHFLFQGPSTGECFRWALTVIRREKEPVVPPELQPSSQAHGHILPSLERLIETDSGAWAAWQQVHQAFAAGPFSSWPYPSALSPAVRCAPWAWPLVEPLLPETVLVSTTHVQVINRRLLWSIYLLELLLRLQSGTIPCSCGSDGSHTTCQDPSPDGLSLFGRHVRQKGA